MIMTRGLDEFFLANHCPTPHISLVRKGWSRRDFFQFVDRGSAPSSLVSFCFRFRILSAAGQPHPGASVP